MYLRRILATSVAIAALLAVAAPAQAAKPEGTPPNECSDTYKDGNPLLGPAELPTRGPVGRELRGYERTGGLTTSQFLSTYYSQYINMGKPGYIFPPLFGYVLRRNGTPIEHVHRLHRGQHVDRYGSEFGSFLAPAGTPFAWRSLTPMSLNNAPDANCNYHDYAVIKPFKVDYGPVAPWFAQPGRGVQYQLDPALVPGAPSTGFNVGWLVAHGYLKRII
ncbi:TNT domain-containing protein [Streptomyces sp. RB6PN25]|uniref:TNT domain-containing protein n=1 Tax=Streptomyces humicola TaxID=2953240 RepID=A0ABT1Q3D6_9ACTN|nr:TNT domain-containing protein [Streptomyces humicola]MCQ4084434.1 TNT domain-containing protein [Streptomyces humicola]